MGMKEFFTASNIEQTINSVTSFTWLPGGTQALFIVQIVFYIIIFCGGFYLYKLFYRDYSAKALIYIKKAGKIVDIKSDNVKIILSDEQGKSKVRLLWLKKTAQLPKNSFKYKLGSRDFFHFIMDDSGALHPCELGETPKELKAYLTPVPGPIRVWSRLERQNIENRFKKNNWIREHLPQILLMSTTMILFMMYYFGFKSLTEIGMNVAGQLGQIATSCTIR